jgi:hypothetical protein
MFPDDSFAVASGTVFAVAGLTGPASEGLSLFADTAAARLWISK